MKRASDMGMHPAARILAVLLWPALAVLAAGSALAQEQARSQGTLEEVIVTAQKRAENVQNVPIAMQAYSGETLANAGINQITDVTRLAPNLNVVVQNAMSQHIVIRGVGTNEFFGNAPSSVGTYMDEVTMNSSYMSTLALFDMERVEVLRGPQNSLFGRNTTGGAVNYITKQPVVGADSVDGDALLTYGNSNLAEVEGGVTIPTGSTAAIRLAGLYHSRDGIWENLDTGDNHYGDEERYSGRATLGLGTIRSHAPDRQSPFRARARRGSAAEDGGSHRRQSAAAHQRHDPAVGLLRQHRLEARRISTPSATFRR